MSIFADLLSSIFERKDRDDYSVDYSGREVTDLVRDLVGGRGEMSGMAIARTVFERYDDMTIKEKRAFFEFIATEMDLHPNEVKAALADYEKNQDKRTYRRFMQASEPRRQELIRRLNQVPGATGKLVKMRADMLDFKDDVAELSALDLDFRHLFVSWFNRGFLVLRPISWETPANILEKIIAYEAVHAIGSWEDLRSRLEPDDRRCFAFFHPAMPDEPLIFVEVALTKGIPHSIQDLLADERTSITAAQADTAVFYSISNCQKGLASISFGNSLIKQVISDVSKELANIGTFVTLSPIPGLAKWVAEQDLDLPTLSDQDVKALASYYLLEAKKKDGYPYDPVARFHLGNGAICHAVHAEADVSEKGRKQSFGAMVNYLYDRSKIVPNHEQFAISYKIAASDDVQKNASSNQFLTQRSA